MQKQTKPQFFNKYFYIICCFLFICNNAFAVNPVNKQDQKNPTSAIEKSTYKKLGLKEKILIKILQRKISKSEGASLMDTISTRKELIISHAKDTRIVKKISEGNIVSIYTNDNIRYDGVLKIIDDENISVKGQIVALKDIDRIQKIKKKRTGAIMMTTGIVSILVSIGVLSETDFDLNPTGVGLLFLLILLGLLCIVIGTLILLVRKIYKRRKWKFEIRSI